MTEQQSAGTRPSWVDDELFPFESHFVELDGHVVHYIDEGSGPILLMLKPSRLGLTIRTATT
jgi:haloalkane dehalogenase